MPSATKAAAKVRTALLVRLQAKPGKEAAVAKFLEGGLPIVEQEPGTVTWYAIKLGPSTFGIFDTFRTMPDVKRTWKAESRLHSWLKRQSYWPARHLLRKWRSWQPSFPADVSPRRLTSACSRRRFTPGNVGLGASWAVAAADARSVRRTH